MKFTQDACVPAAAPLREASPAHVGMRKLCHFLRRDLERDGLTHVRLYIIDKMFKHSHVCTPILLSTAMYVLPYF